MRKFQARRNFKKLVLSSLSLVVLLVVLVFLANATFKVYVKNSLAVERNGKVKMQIVELEKRKSELETELQRLQTRSGVEGEIRRKFNMQKPGEKVLTIIENENADTDINNNQSKKGLFSNAWTAIKNLWAQ